MVFGRVNAFSQMLRNSVRKLFFSEVAGSLGGGQSESSHFDKRDRPRVSERLLLDAPGGYGVCQEKEETGKDDHDFKLRSPKPWEEVREVNIPPVIHCLADEIDAVLIGTNTKKPETPPTPSIVAAHALPAGCNPVGSTSMTNARSTA